MLSRIFGKKAKVEDDVIVKAVVTQTAALINDLHHQMDLRFKELSAQVKEVELGLAQMETKLLTKDLKDKQAYGLIHYKLHEAKNTKLQDEISDLELQLSLKKSVLKDQ
jgi:DNA-binding HxlR family transcriptional regulator